MNGEIELLRHRIAELEARLAEAERREQTHCLAPEVGARPALDVQDTLGTSLTEQQALLAKAEQIGQLGTWVWDLATDKVSWSSAMYSILGYDPKVDAPTGEAFFQRIHPDDVHRVRSTSLQNATTGESAPTDCRLLLPSGEVREVIVDGVAIRWDSGKPARFVGTLLDVTRRKAEGRELERSRDFLNEAQRIAKVGSFTWDYATNSMTWSDELYRMTGIEPGTRPDMDVVADLIHKEDRPRALERALSALALGETKPDDFRIVRRGDGATLNVHVAARPRRGEHGELEGFIGTVLDVTERERLEEQLRQSQKMEALGRLAGGVAHDFNNLLTVIEGYTQILLRQGPREELEQIAAASAAAADLTRRLLAFSRHAVVEPVALDLNAAVQSATKLISRVIGEDIRVTLELEPSPWAIRADPSQIHQVLLNLTLNARDAMPHGGRLVIRTANVSVAADDRCDGADELEERVLLEISDTGVGMDAATKARIFEPFFTTKGPGKGTGIGLATVLAIVRRCHATVEVASALGQGTTFRLYFPRTSEAVPESRRRSTHPPLGGSQGVLLVEDDAAVRRLVSRVLEEAGYRVYAARLPSEARSIWRNEGKRISLLVTDVIMPEQSGRELARDLRIESGGSLKVLYITGHAPRIAPGDETPLDALHLGKPFSPDLLLAKVRRALQR